MTTIFARLPRLIAFTLLLAAIACGAAVARSLEGVVRHVTDGDTLWVQPAAGAALQIRIAGIDAPEICQPFGPQARDALAARVLHRPVVVATRARDIYHRTVGRVSSEGHDIGAWLVSGGYAWSPGYRHHPGPYAAEETHARQARRGLWAAAATEPKEFRKRHGSCHRAARRL
ncbi:MAG: thermonuclease family protein [Pseudomonadota bacterium]|nr:thermonuclease family protein [Pseudomonadota bacterium]